MAADDSFNEFESDLQRELEYEANLSALEANGLNPYFLEDLSIWLNAIKSYTMETGANSLDLKLRGLRAKEVKSILELLHNTQVVELNLESNHLGNGIKTISEPLVQSKIRKLNIRDCDICGEELIDFMSILNATKITDLDLSENIVKDGELDENEFLKIISTLLESRLRTLGFCAVISLKTDSRALELLAEGLPNTSFTNLDFSFTLERPLCLLSKISQTSITELNLESSAVTINDLKVLGENLKESKLEKLVLSRNEISDAGINVLVQGLRGAKVSHLQLDINKISGSNNLGHYLRGSEVKTLNIAFNPIKQRRMFSFPDFLKGTAVVSLDIRSCGLGDQLGQELIRSLKSTMVKELNIGKNELGPLSISEFASSVRDMNVMNVNFARNEFSAETFVLLGACLNDSKLECIDVSYCCKRNEVVGLFYFLECTKNTSIVSVNIAGNKLGMSGGELLGRVLRGTSLTHLNASCNKLGSSVSSLAAHLRETDITHLKLWYNELRDDAAEALAKSLKFSKIVELDVSDNFITSQGAKAFAFSLEESNLLCLRLSQNKIETDGLETLAEHAKRTFITTLDVDDNPGDRILLVDAVLWKNRTSAQKLVSLFKNIKPEVLAKGSCFDLKGNTENMKNLLEDLLVFYKICLKNQNSAATVLLQEASLPVQREQIMKIFSEFPGQFALFLGKEIEADVAQHVNILEKAEALGLTNIVELLLQNRPVYVMDETQNILHPRVYMLLHKYKQPLCNFDVELQGREKIIKYFQDHADVEGALDVINMLQSAMPM